MLLARPVLAAVLLAAALGASADEAAVRRMVEQKLRSSGQLESVQKISYANLYEVVVRGPDGPGAYYVDDRAAVIIASKAFDASTGRNLTEERERKLNAVKWESLPLQWAITSVRGSGRRKIAVLSDPNCPFCQRFEEDLAKLDDITVHILHYAILRPTSMRQAKGVWCSKDRAKAWDGPHVLAHRAARRGLRYADREAHRFRPQPPRRSDADLVRGVRGTLQPRDAAGAGAAPAGRGIAGEALSGGANDMMKLRVLGSVALFALALGIAGWAIEETAKAGP